MFTFSILVRQKLTSPKWNSFKGVRLRWKDKIRLNNLIWRCWHMQCEYYIELVCTRSVWQPFSLISVILRKRMMVCQFASPLDVDIHSKPEVNLRKRKTFLKYPSRKPIDDLNLSIAGCCAGRKILETSVRCYQSRIHEMAKVSSQ